MSRLQGHLIALDEPVTVVQVSEGGMTLRTRNPLTPNATHEFRVWMGDTPLLVQGTVRHRQVIVSNDDVTYHMGVQFVDPPHQLLERLRGLMASPHGRSA